MLNIMNCIAFAIQAYPLFKVSVLQLHKSNVVRLYHNNKSSLYSICPQHTQHTHNTVKSRLKNFFPLFYYISGAHCITIQSTPDIVLTLSVEILVSLSFSSVGFSKKSCTLYISPICQEENILAINNRRSLQSIHK